MPGDERRESAEQRRAFRALTLEDQAASLAALRAGRDQLMPGAGRAYVTRTMTGLERVRRRVAVGAAPSRTATR